MSDETMLEEAFDLASKKYLGPEDLYPCQCFPPGSASDKEAIS